MALIWHFYKKPLRLGVNVAKFKTRKACVDWLRENKAFFNKKGLYAPVKGADSYKESKGWDDFLGKAKNKN